MSLFCMLYLYSICCVLGTVLPLASFAPWLAEHGLDIERFVQAALINQISRFAWADLIVSSMALTLFVVAESRRLNIRHGRLALLGLMVGVSLALPLFLLLRELHLRHSSPHTETKVK